MHEYTSMAHGSGIFCTALNTLTRNESIQINQLLLWRVIGSHRIAAADEYLSRHNNFHHKMFFFIFECNNHHTRSLTANATRTQHIHATLQCWSFRLYCFRLFGFTRKVRQRYPLRIIMYSTVVHSLQRASMPCCSQPRYCTRIILLLSILRILRDIFGSRRCVFHHRS